MRVIDRLENFQGFKDEEGSKKEKEMSNEHIYSREEKKFQFPSKKMDKWRLGLDS